MSGDVARDILLSDPLSEITRKERKCLLTASVVGIAIAKADLVPSKITALGVEFSQTNQRALMLVLGCVALYFLLAFIFYAWQDFLTWIRRFNKSRAKSIREEFKLEEEMKNRTITSEVMMELERTKRLIRKTAAATFGSFFERHLWKPSVIVRVLFDFILPIAVGIYACWALFSWTAPMANNVKSGLL